MRSSPLGTDISPAEVTSIDGHGIWVFVKGKEYFLPYEDYPWFKHARIADIANMQLLHGVHLHWPTLDVDLSIDSLEDPSAYPLVAER
jgi:hypothetical protein